LYNNILFYYTCNVKSKKPFGATVYTTKCYWICGRKSFQEHLRSLLLCTNGAFGVYLCIGSKHPLCEVQECVVPISNSQSLGFEEDAYLAVVSYSQWGVGSQAGRL